MKKTTIKDIAKKLEVSPSTVSRALHNHPDISDTLKYKIQETARILKYRPSSAAIHLKQGRSKSIALILPQITSFFYPSVIHGMEEVLHNQGYTLVILPTNDLLEREKENINIAYDQNVDGVMIAVTKETLDTDHFEILHESDIPVIMVDKVIENANCTCITIDDYKVSYQMVQHLYKSGCRKIAGIFGKANLSISHLRYKGFIQALKDVNLECAESMVCFVNNSREAKEKSLTILKEHNPDGLYVMTDEIMLGVMPSISEMKLQVPKDISILAISDGYLPTYMVPSISHLKHDGYELGMISAQKMIQYINAKNNNLLNNVEKIMLNTSIVLMESTK